MATGRIGNNQLTQDLIFQLHGKMTEQQRIYEQISSNRRILRPSDDPLGTRRALLLTSQQNRVNGYESVISAANTATNITATALDDATSTWSRVSEIATSAADTTKTAADRMGMGQELEQLLEHLVQTSNTSYGGKYIFGGSETGRAAFRAETDPNTNQITGVFYDGNSDLQHVKTSDGNPVTIGIAGSNAGNPNVQGTFIDSQSGVDAFKTLITLRDKLLDNDTIGLSGSDGVLAQVDKVARSITAASVRLGGCQEALDLDKNRVTGENTAIDQNLSDVVDADSVELIMQLNNVQNVYQAALSSAGRILQKSLLNYI